MDKPQERRVLCSPNDVDTVNTLIVMIGGALNIAIIDLKKWRQSIDSKSIVSSTRDRDSIVLFRPER